MINTLRDIYDDVNNWLKFAEAKNGAIIALNSALIFGILKFFTSLDDVPVLLSLFAFVGLFMLTVSIIIALLSFIPRLTHPYIKVDKISTNDNLLYFGDIAKYDKVDYRQKLTAMIATKKDEENEKLIDSKISQIIVNSKITFIKYKQFEIAVWLTISAFLTPLGAYILYKARS